MPEKFTDVAGYLDSLAPQARAVVEEVRAILRDAVPGGVDAIRYNIPTLVRDGRSVVHFAGWAKHVSVYPAPDPGADEELARELATYQSGRGTLKFPLSQPLPRDLIATVGRLLSDAAD